jgi:mono/diheme cytochrome c family protein
MGFAAFFFFAGVWAVLLFATPAWPGNPDHGQELYVERCVLCHGSKGYGWDWDNKVDRPPVPVPNLVDILPQRSDDYLFRVIRNGGEAVGRTRFMPAFGFNTTEQELKDLVAYLRSLQGKGK